MSHFYIVGQVCPENGTLVTQVELSAADTPGFRLAWLLHFVWANLNEGKTMHSQPTNPLLLDETSHVVVLLDSLSLKPGRPEASALFERAAELEHNTGCDVTIAHLAAPATTEENLREHLALRVLVKRANEHFAADFDVAIRYSSADCDDIRRLVTDKNGDLLLLDHSDSGGLDAKEQLLQQSSFPLWYVARSGEIDEVSAALSGIDGVQANDQLTCSVAQHIGANLGSTVNYLQSETDSTIASDLVVAYAPGAPKKSAELAEHLHAKKLLESSEEFDVLIHRGTQSQELAHAA